VVFLLKLSKNVARVMRCAVRQSSLVIRSTSQLLFVTISFHPLSFIIISFFIHHSDAAGMVADSPESQSGMEACGGGATTEPPKTH